MSFSEIRAARQGKEEKSFVQQSNIPGNPGPPSPEQVDLQDNQVQIVPRNDLYKCITPDLEIRSSQTSGRGLWAKKEIYPGRVFHESIPTH